MCTLMNASMNSMRESSGKSGMVKSTSQPFGMCLYHYRAYICMQLLATVDNTLTCKLTCMASGC